MAVREGSYYNNSKKPIKKVRVVRYYSYYNKKNITSVLI